MSYFQSFLAFFFFWGGVKIFIFLIQRFCTAVIILQMITIQALLDLESAMSYGLNFLKTIISYR